LNINGQQFGLLNEANEGDAGNDGQQFGLLNGANHGLNLTNEGEAAKDLSDLIEDHIIEVFLFEDHDATVDNESGHVDGSVSDNTKTASTAAGDPFDSLFADEEAADKDQRQQDAEERANNQNSQNNEQAEEPVDNADNNGLFEVKEYLSHGNGMVFVEWVEQKRGEWGTERFGWIAEEDVQGGLSVFMEKYTPLKEEVPIYSVTQKCFYLNSHTNTLHN
jgi:hypothetical protein